MLLILDLLLSIITTILLGQFVLGWSFWLLLLEIALLLGYIALTFIILFLMAIPVRKKGDFNPKHSKFYRFFMDETLVFLMQLGRVHLHIEGKEKLPSKQRFLLVTNHMSKFDPMVMNVAFRGKEIAWVAKRSLFKMPFVNRYMYKCCFMPLDRDDLRQGLKVIRQSVQYIKENQVSIGICPEGTRNTTSEIMLPFRPGSFKIAYLAEVPIVVVTSAHTEQVAKRWPFRSTHIYMNVLDVIPFEEYKDIDSVLLSEKIEKRMVESITELRKKKV